MTVEYICKECGGKVEQFCYTSYPAIYVTKCTKCGRVISEEREMITYKEV